MRQNIKQQKRMEMLGFVTPAKAAELASIHRVTLYGMIKHGKIRTARCGSRVYVDLASLHDLFKVIEAKLDEAS